MEILINRFRLLDTEIDNWDPLFHNDHKYGMNLHIVNNDLYKTHGMLYFSTCASLVEIRMTVFTEQV